MGEKKVIMLAWKDEAGVFILCQSGQVFRLNTEQGVWDLYSELV